MEFSNKYIVIFLLLAFVLLYGGIQGSQLFNFAKQNIENITGIQNNTINDILGTNIKDCSKVTCTPQEQSTYNNYVITQQLYGNGNSYANSVIGDKYLTYGDLNGIKVIIYNKGVSSTYTYQNNEWINSTNNVNVAIHNTFQAQLDIFKKEITDYMTNSQQVINRYYKLIIPNNGNQVTITYRKVSYNINGGQNNPFSYQTHDNTVSFSSDGVIPSTKLILQQSTNTIGSTQYFFKETCGGIIKYESKPQGTQAIQTYTNFDIRCLGVNPYKSITGIETGNYITSLLNFIGKYESNQYGYQQLVSAKNLPQTMDLTSMTIQQVINFQNGMIPQGYPSTAVGKYQIIQPTLERLIQIKKINDPTFDIKTQKFDANTQDMFAIMLLQEAGLNDYLDKKITLNTFGLNLAKIWASLPKDSTGISYYNGVGTNKALVNWNIYSNELTYVYTQYNQNTQTSTTTQT